MDKRLIGFVVNVWDPLNYQIDLPINPELEKKIFHEKYKYVDPPGVELKEGKVFRCRLRNIKKINVLNVQKTKELEREMENRISRLNGWVLCEPFHIDTYHRLIVDLYDPITLENFYDIIIKHEDIVESY